MATDELEHLIERAIIRSACTVNKGLREVEVNEITTAGDGRSVEFRIIARMDPDRIEIHPACTAMFAS